jgi:tol-pal system protein YbgF
MTHRAVFFSVLMLLLTGTGAQAASGSVEMRLRALESRLPDADRLAALEQGKGSQAAAILSADVEQLKVDVRDLRGLIEQLTHELKKQQEGQRKLYADIDRRLQALEGRAAAQVVSSVPDPNVTGTVPANAAGQSPLADPVGIPNPGQAAGEQAEYLAAFELLQQGKTLEAIPAFQSFLAKYPKGSYSANAMYWLGEASYVNKNYPQAAAEFQKLLDQFPDSPKVSGALLKIGYIHYETKNYPQARAVLEKVKATYPNTNVGTLAAERLARMSKEGV